MKITEYTTWTIIIRNMSCTEKSYEVANSEKLKILAIHGYRQNAETFRQKTGSFRKAVNKWAEFTYITAPHKVVMLDDKNNSNIGQSSDEEQYGWFFNKEDKTFRGVRQGGPAIGFDESVQFIEETYQNIGPFDGIWGFSQGACFVSLLCDLQQRGLLKCKFNFAILVAGFKSNSIPHSDYLKETIKLPSLHIFGIGDQIIPVEMSMVLSECFEESVVVKHAGGHFVPASSGQKEPYQNFLRSRYMLKHIT